jgi:DNA/RNA-binding domain of Phe-tRNA-synthetase-like protein
MKSVTEGVHKLMTMTFQYHTDILARYPDLVGGVILLRGASNGPTAEAARSVYSAEQEAVKTKIGQTPLSQLESLAAWRGAFRAFGVDPTQYRSAAEALLRRLTKKGDIPSINLLVDLGNMLSIRYAMPIAVLDVQAIQGPITVHFSDGTERFTPLGRSEIEHPEPGEVVFSDETGMVVARRWCWRQSDESAARETTTDAIITLEAHHATAQADVESAINDLSQLLTEYTGGRLVSGILGQGQTSITGE